jgi:hypothetical protein
MQLPPVARLQASIHAIVPDDLPGMPPDRAIEFKIELQCGTALVYNCRIEWRQMSWQN